MMSHETCRQAHERSILEIIQDIVESCVETICFQRGVFPSAFFVMKVCNLESFNFSDIVFLTRPRF